MNGFALPVNSLGTNWHWVKQLKLRNSFHQLTVLHSIFNINSLAGEPAPRHKRLVARLLPLGYWVCVSVTPCGFHGGRTGVLVGFYSGFPPFSPVTNFIPLFLHPHLIHYVSFHFIRRCAFVSGIVGRVIHRPSNVGASSHLIPWRRRLSVTSWALQVWMEWNGARKTIKIFLREFWILLQI